MQKSPLLRHGSTSLNDMSSYARLANPSTYHVSGREIKGRFMDREAGYHQSDGVWNIKRIAREANWWNRKIYMRDWFHTLVHIPTLRLVLIFFVLYYLIFLLFAIIYHFLQSSCDVKHIQSFFHSFTFSFQTMMTVSYTLPGIETEDCGGIAIIMSIQCLLTVFLNAIVVGVFMGRMSRSETRGMTVIFSNKAVIQEIDGHFYFMFQVAELRKHQLVDAHVRCYGLSRTITSDVHKFQCHRMRLSYPDDERGSFIMLAFPTVVVHRIDRWSPLYPYCLQEKKERMEQHDPAQEYVFPDIRLRGADAAYGDHNSEENLCTVCGQDFRNTRLLKMHLEYQAEIENLLKYSCNSCSEIFSSNDSLKIHLQHEHNIIIDTKDKNKISRHQSLLIELFDNKTSHQNKPSSEDIAGIPNNPMDIDRMAGDGKKKRKTLRTWLNDTNFEVVCMVEGNDDVMSGSVQAKHSYSFCSDEIIFDHSFGSCVSVNEEGRCELNFDHFHDIIPVNKKQPDASENFSSFQ